MSADGSEVALLARIWFVNVGAGDCTLIMDRATRRAVLVDCPTWGIQEVQRLLLDEDVILDTVIVTHWDLDHYGGASRLAVSRPVRRILYNHDTLFPSEDTPENLIRTTLKNFLDVPTPGEVLGPAAVGESGHFGSIAWRIVAPTHAELTEAYVGRRRNIASSVVDVRVGNFRLLIGGDAVGPTWRRLLTEGDLHADILRWPHHGADLAGDRDGTIRDGVLAAVQPDFVIISTGARNPHGHPSEAVVARAASESSVLCTQVTPGCFGFITRAERRTSAARSIIESLATSHCADTVYVECRTDGYTMVPSVSDHRRRIAEWPQPLCRVLQSRTE